MPRACGQKQVRIVTVSVPLSTATSASGPPRSGVQREELSRLHSRSRQGQGVDGGVDFWRPPSAFLTDWLGFFGADQDTRRVTAGSQIPGTRRVYEDTDGHRGAAI
jgi:hypothetical protein